MIDPCEPLGHAIVVCIFRPERELKPTSGDGAKHRPGGSCQAPVSSNSAKGGAPIGDQSGAIFAVFENVGLCDGRIRGAESRPDKVIVEVRRPQGKLGLLQGKEAVVMPGGLPESNKGKRVPSHQPCICPLGLMDVGEELRTKKVWRWFRGLECSQLAKYLAA